MAEPKPKSALNPPQEILAELGEESDEYDDIEEEGEHEEGGYEDENEEEDEGDEEAVGGSSLTAMLISTGGPDIVEDEPEDDEADDEYQEPPTPVAGIKRTREEDGVRDTGDEKEGYVTDVNENTTSEKDAKKVKV